MLNTDHATGDYEFCWLPSPGLATGTGTVLVRLFRPHGWAATSPRLRPPENRAYQAFAEEAANVKIRAGLRQAEKRLNRFGRSLRRFAKRISRLNW